MKISFVWPCALACLINASHASAQSSVTIYGVADAGVEMSNSGNGTAKRLISGGAQGSRLGFRGSEDLGGGLSAVFRLEQGLTIDDGQLGQGSRAFGREASVGLASKSLGTVSLGRLPTPFYMVQPYVDAFAWMGGGGLVAITRSGSATRQLLPNAINAREDNAIGYVTPTIGGAEVRALVAAGEGSVNIGRAYGLSGRYVWNALDLVAGWVRQEGAGDNSGAASSFVVGGSYNFGPAKAFLGLTDEKNSCTTCTGSLARAVGVTGTNASEFRLYNAGVRVPFGVATAIFQATRVDDRSRYAVNPGDRDATWLAVGLEYALSRRTVIYSSLATINNKNGSQYALGSGTAQQPAAFVAAGNPHSTTATLGVRHLF